MEGTVVSDKMHKTRVVAVTRQKKHPVYKKYFAVTKKYKAHDEENAYHTGDIVEIMQIRPMSRDKRWKIVKLLSKKQDITHGEKEPKNDTESEL